MTLAGGSCILVRSEEPSLWGKMAQLFVYFPTKETTYKSFGGSSFVPRQTHRGTWRYFRRMIPPAYLPRSLHTRSIVYFDYNLC